MKYLLNAKQMKSIDTFSIEQIGIPSLVLMERAALAVTESVLRDIKSMPAHEKLKVLCICGRGNNGADGLCVARQLTEHGINAEVLIVGDVDKTGTEEYEHQKKILRNIGVVFRNKADFSEYNFIIDAIFGIGLSRAVEGEYAKLIGQINQIREKHPGMKVVAVDIPSGISADNGVAMGIAVKADETITFGYDKIGLVKYPGAAYAGRIQTAQIGFAGAAITQLDSPAVYYTRQDLQKIPDREQDSNKGTYGKVLLIAGSESMAGAACLSARACYRTGCGLVKVLTHEINRNVVMSAVPEAITDVYTGQEDQEQLADLIQKNMDWASVIILGPGIGMSHYSYDIVKTVLETGKKGGTKKPLILDADALNLVSSSKELMDLIPYANVILTPHMGEMSRLTGKSIAQLKLNTKEEAESLARKTSGVCVLKDAVTVVSDGKQAYYNRSGNSGMSTAGCGDVLTGVIAGMLCTGMNPYESACMGVYVHGLAGDQAADESSAYAMTASDIIESLKQVLSK